MSKKSPVDQLLELSKRLSIHPTDVTVRQFVAEHGWSFQKGWSWSTLKDAAGRLAGTKTVEQAVIVLPKPKEVIERNRYRDQHARQVQINKSMADELDAIRRQTTILEMLKRDHVGAPVKSRGVAHAGKREATAVALASDWHVEETVEAATVNGVNEYNIDIAEQRARRFFDGVRWLIDLQRNQFEISDVILWLGGDLISGYIHEELLESNSMSPTKALRFARRLIRHGIDGLLQDEKIEALHVLCNRGNHGRTTQKKRHSTGADNSFEHLMYQVLADDYENDGRVDFTISKSTLLYFDVYGFRTRWHHGDDIRYVGGVGGLDIPLNKAVASWDVGNPAHITNVGHYHTYTSTPRTVRNGSLIGYNPFALAIKARYEPPQQAFYLIDEKRGKTADYPIWVD